jgi:hypothetical protein
LKGDPNESAYLRAKSIKHLFINVQMCLEKKRRHFKEEFEKFNEDIPEITIIDTRGENLLKSTMLKWLN